VFPQLGLPLKIRQETTFNNFFNEPDSARGQVVEALSRFPFSDTLIYLWGQTGAGANHLIQACCNQLLSQGFRAQYLPLAELVQFDPESLISSLEEVDLVAIEGLEEVVADSAWEEALFRLFNRIRDLGNHLLVTANQSPYQMDFTLQDLKSRLCSGLTFHLEPYTDDEKIEILRFRGDLLGLEISGDTAGFILRRGDRDLDDLMDTLSVLDRASLESQRKVTIPFIKQVMHW
jgi:DnaA family protein